MEPTSRGCPPGGSGRLSCWIWVPGAVNAYPGSSRGPRLTVATEATAKRRVVGRAQLRRR